MINMKSQKGVTMISLILYVASFLAITAVVAGITTFFYNNVEILDTSIGSNSQYNKFNLYILNECKKEGNSLFAWKNTDTTISSSDTPNNISALAIAPTEESTNQLKTFITFSDNSGNKNSFIYVSDEKNLYYNSIKLCDKVEDFKFKIDYSTGKPVLNVFINIGGTTFTTEYVVAS